MRCNDARDLAKLARPVDKESGNGELIYLPTRGTIRYLPKSFGIEAP